MTEKEITMLVNSLVDRDEWEAVECIRELQARLELLEKDAARYRWLRLGASSNRVPHITQWPAQRGEDYAQISIVGIDAAIDTAVQAQGKTND